MIEDRDYMRQPEYEQRHWPPNFRLRWSWTTALLAAYVVVFLAELITPKFFPDSHLFFGHVVRNGAQLQFVPGDLALSKEGVENGFVWQLVTYQFLHGGWLHLFFNCWAIYIFGRELEYLLGGRRFLGLMFASGIVGGIFQVLTAMVWPELFGGGEIVGASACAFGLVAAFAMIFPERELTMLLFFVIPVRLRAKTLLILSAVLAVAGIVFPWDNVANAAHLGGMAMGWFYVKGILKNPALIDAADEREFAPPRVARKKAAPPAEKSADEFLESEVDPILDKISAHGIQSLTTREREVLEAARKKMAQR
jgi:membrane associated rhomboid family serine protease